jgi:hypothetical protein
MIIDTDKRDMLWASRALSASCIDRYSLNGACIERQPVAFCCETFVQRFCINDKKKGRWEEVATAIDVT